MLCMLRLQMAPVVSVKSCEAWHQMPLAVGALILLACLLASRVNLELAHWDRVL